MKIIIIISIVLIILIIILLYFQIKQYNSITYNLEILQINEITKDNLEIICRNNQPIVIHKFPQNAILNINENKPVICQDKYISDKRNKIKLNKLLTNKNHKLYLVDWDASEIVDDNYLKLINNYHSPISNAPTNTLTIFNTTFNRYLTRTNASRNIYICLSGECIFRLYHPKYIKKLEFLKNTHPHYDIYPKDKDGSNLTESQFIEIILRENQGLIIPRYWMFTYYIKKDNTNCILLNSKSFDFIGVCAKYFL